MRIEQIKRRLAGAEYVVDTRAVAEAILRRDSTRHLLLAGLSVRGGSTGAQGAMRPLQGR